MKRIPLKSGDEQDALTGFRRWLHFKPGERKRIRRAYNKRLRRELKKELRHAASRALRSGGDNEEGE